MADRRVVYPLYLMDEPQFGRKYWSMLDQLITSMTSYFQAGNTTPVLVGTDSDEVRIAVERVAGHFGFPVEVSVYRPADIEYAAGKHARTICGKNTDGCRFGVVASKIFTILQVGQEYDRLIVDADTLWFGRIPWDRFGRKGMTMFAPSQWKHALSVTIGQILYYRCRYLVHSTMEEYCRSLVRADEKWRSIPIISSLPWPNSGVLYMSSDYVHEKYVPELYNPVLPLLAVEDETPLVSLLLDGGGYETGMGLNVPVAFTDITMEPDPLHPYGILCAHFHRNPKPDAFDITYSGVLRHPELHECHSLDFLRDSVAPGQYGSMSGTLWCYVWRYYFSIAAGLYRNGDDTPVYGPDFWKRIIDGYCDGRQVWLDSVQAQKSLMRIDL